MACMSCVNDWREWDPIWYEEGCIDGRIYGYCSSESCGGMCDYVGDCNCDCHEQEVQR